MYSAVCSGPGIPHLGWWGMGSCSSHLWLAPGLYVSSFSNKAFSLTHTTCCFEIHQNPGAWQVAMQKELNLDNNSICTTSRPSYVVLYRQFPQWYNRDVIVVSESMCESNDNSCEQLCKQQRCRETKHSHVMVQRWLTECWRGLDFSISLARLLTELPWATYSISLNFSSPMWEMGVVLYRLL